MLIRPGALGDALLALPTLALLRRERPGAHVTLVARGDVLRLVRSSSLADAVYDWAGSEWAALFADGSLARSTVEAQAVVRGATVAAWLADTDGMVARSLATWDAAQVVIAPGRPPPDEGSIAAVPRDRREHMALLLARALAPLGIAVPATVEALATGMPPLRADAEDEREALLVWQTRHLAPRRTVALHVGSGGAAKRWPAQQFAALARRLIAHGWQPLLVEGPADTEVTAAVLAALGPPTHEGRVVRGLDVSTLVALLPRCMGYVGNDSGVSHLAALAGVPTLALFGPSDPACWAPLGSRVHTLRAPGGDMAALEVGAVWAALRGILSPVSPV